jgi:hypothetical protein
MNKLFRNIGFALAALSALAISSCKTDFDVTTDYQVKPVVFGLLDQEENYHYIRINKTFLGTGNALDFAQVPDSSYFNTVDATVTEILANGSQGRVWQLRDTLLQNKNENGVFFGPEHKLYYFYTPDNNPLKDDATYKFHADLNNGEYEIDGQTKLIAGVSLSVPSAQTAISFKSGGINPEYKGAPFTWTKGNGNPTIGLDGKQFNLKLEFHYNETIGGNVVPKFFTWNVSEVVAETGGNFITVTAAGESFYQLIKSKIPVDPEVTRREHTYFDIVLTAGSLDLYNYMLAVQPASSLAQNKPTYTNLEGGLGLFSARQTIRIRKYFIDPLVQTYRSLDQNSTKELCDGPYTFNLEFCSNHVMDNTQSFRCQ